MVTAPPVPPARQSIDLMGAQPLPPTQVDVCSSGDLTTALDSAFPLATPRLAVGGRLGSLRERITFYRGITPPCIDGAQPRAGELGPVAHVAPGRPVSEHLVPQVRAFRWPAVLPSG